MRLLWPGHPAAAEMSENRALDLCRRTQPSPWGAGQECLWRGAGVASPGAGTECSQNERPGVHRCPPSLSSMGGLQPSLGQISRGRRPVPLGGEFPSGSSFSRNGPEGVGGPLFPGTPAPPALPSCWVGGAVEGSRLSPGPGKTSVRGCGVPGMLAHTYGPGICIAVHATYVSWVQSCLRLSQHSWCVCTRAYVCSTDLIPDMLYTPSPPQPCGVGLSSLVAS